MYKKLVIFVIKCLAAIVLTLCTIVTLLYIPIAYGHPLSVIINLKQLAEKSSTSSEKIIFLLSGSSSWVGINGKELKTINHMRLVNMGVYAGFDIQYQFHLIRKYIRPGDILLCSPEYGVIFDKRNSDIEARKWMFITAPGYALKYCYRFPAEFDNVLIDIGKLCQWKIVGFIRGIAEGYTGGIFNGGYVKFYKKADEFGTAKDQEFSKIARKDIVIDSLIDSKYSKEYCDILDSIAYCTETKKVKFYFLPPPYPLEEYEKNRIKIDSFYTYLSTKKSITLLGSPVENMYNMDCFTNSINHIDANTRKKRTNAVCTVLLKSTDIQF